MKLFHRHDWREVHRAYLFQPHGNEQVWLDVEILPSPRTVITFRCAVCAEYKQSRLIGHIPNDRKEKSL